MHPAVLREIKTRLNLLFETDTDFFVKLRVGTDFTAFALGENAYTRIADSDCTHQFFCIDGGNNTLFASTVFSLSTIRICAYGDAQNTVVHTFFLIVQQTEKQFELSLIPADVTSETFLETVSYPKTISLSDAEFRAQSQKIELQTLVSFIRRLLELQLAKGYEFVLLDGSLESKYSLEQQILVDYYASQKRIIGVSKTSSMVTEHGIPATLYFSRLAPKKQPWFVSGIVTSLNFEICFAKFVSAAKYIFRVDVPNYVDKNTVFSQIASHSSDVSFLGYPYGLIRADELARVSEDELQFMRNRFLGSLDTLTRQQLEQIRTTNSAHSVLDSMKF